MYTRRATDKDATWARAWTADDLTDLDAITALPGPNGPRRGDVAYVESEANYYWWMDNGTWVPASAGGTTDVEGKVMISQGVGVEPIFSNTPNLSGSGAQLRLSASPTTRYAGIALDDPSGSIDFSLSDQPTSLKVYMRSNQVALGAAPGFTPPTPLIFTNPAGAPIIFISAEAGGAGLVQFGRRFSDDNPACGVRAQFWGITGQSTPVLAVMAPGGAATVVEIDVDGNVIVKSVNLTDGTFALKSSVALDDGAAANAGTLNNAPAAGDPTKWIAIDDNGTTRYIPCW